MIRWIGRAFLLAALIGLVLAEDDPNYEVHFDGMEMIDGSDSYFNYNYTMDKKSETAFTVSGFITQLVLLDNTYKARFRLSRAPLDNPELYEEMLGLEKPLCEYMSSIYKMYFYETLKDISNFPHYDKCPLDPAEYWFKDYSFDADEYKAFMRDGHYKIEMYLVKGEDSVAGGLSKMRVEPVEGRK
ncbi:hypothetical protein RP20_CCG010572 [Aedes albopictus]|nr:hypothetical protein RP20_CCG010572 [Aedes albopictus]